MVCVLFGLFVCVLYAFACFACDVWCDVVWFVFCLFCLNRLRVRFANMLCRVIMLYCVMMYGLRFVLNSMSVWVLLYLRVLVVSYCVMLHGLLFVVCVCLCVVCVCVSSVRG